MLVLGVIPAGAQFRFPLGLFLLGAADALLGGPWGLAAVAAVVAGRSPPLGVRSGRGEEGEGEDWEEAGLNHGAISRFVGNRSSDVARRTNTVRRRSIGRAGIQGS